MYIQQIICTKIHLMKVPKASVPRNDHSTEENIDWKKQSYKKTQNFMETQRKGNFFGLYLILYVNIKIFVCQWNVCLTFNNYCLTLLYNYYFSKLY